MKSWLYILFAFLMGVAISSCTFPIQDTPELRAKIAAYNSGNPIPDLPQPEPSPEPCLDILGNINASGEHIYHMQGQANYNNVKPEAYFCTVEEAEAAGYRPSLR